jgi:hypothetical protein
MAVLLINKNAQDTNEKLIKKKIMSAFANNFIVIAQQ